MRVLREANLGALIIPFFTAAASWMFLDDGNSGEDRRANRLFLGGPRGKDRGDEGVRKGTYGRRKGRVGEGALDSLRKFLQEEGVRNGFPRNPANLDMNSAGKRKRANKRKSGGQTGKRMRGA